MDAFKALEPAETGDMLRRIHDERMTVLFKFGTTAVLRAKASKRGWGRNIICARPANMPDGHKNQVTTVNVVIDGEIYFVRATAKYDKRQLHLQLQTELHQLVRRKNQRFAIPAKTELFLLTKKINDRQLYVKGVVQDLSSGGCRVALNTATPAIASGDFIVGYFKLGRRKPYPVAGVVRHRKSHVTGRFDQSFGFEYEPMELADAKRYAQLLLEAQRNTFVDFTT